MWGCDSNRPPLWVSGTVPCKSFHSGSGRSAEFCTASPKVTIYIFFYHSPVLSATSGWPFITTVISSVTPEVDLQTRKQSGHSGEFLLFLMLKRVLLYRYILSWCRTHSPHKSYPTELCCRPFVDHKIELNFSLIFLNWHMVIEFFHFTYFYYSSFSLQEPRDRPKKQSDMHHYSNKHFPLCQPS